MTEEKAERLVKAFTVTGTILLVLLICILCYQFLCIKKIRREKADLEARIEQLQEQVENKEGDLEYYRSELYLENAARKYHYIFPGDVKE